VRRPECSLRQKVARSLKSGLWETPQSEELRAHADACAECSEIALVAGWLEEERDRAAAESRLPDAGLVFWKAQLLARRAAAESAAEPVVNAERIARVCSIVGIGALAVWQRHTIGEWLQRSSLLAVLGIAGALLLMAFAFYFTRAEE
jgi:hypothetical protein